MKLPTWVKVLLYIELAAALCVLLITVPLRLYVSNAVVRIQYAMPGFPPSTRFDTAERIRISEPMLGYLRGTSTLEDMATVRTDEGEIAMREDEVSHMEDVKGVIDGFWCAHWIALPVALASLLVLWSGKERLQIARAMRQSVWIMAGLFVGIIAFALIDFNLFFTRFHQIFFEEGTWVFWETDTLIQLYPLVFWVRVILAIAVTVLVEAAALLWGANRLARSGAEEALPEEAIA